MVPVHCNAGEQERYYGIAFMTIYCTQKLGFDITQAGTVVGLFGLGAIVGAFLADGSPTGLDFTRSNWSLYSAGALCLLLPVTCRLYNALHQQFCT